MAIALLFIDVAPDEFNDQILGDLSTTSLIAILGGTFIALLIAFICICVFMKRINKSDQNEVVNQNSSSIAGATVCHLQRSILHPNKALRWSFLQKQQVSTVNHFRKKLHISCFTEFKMRP